MRDRDDPFQGHQSAAHMSLPPDSAAPESAGSRLESLATPEDHRYHMGVLLGAGGMGRVVSAHDARLDREVALKRPNPELTGDLEVGLAREAWITARLDHPGIVPVYDAGLGAAQEAHMAATHARTARDEARRDLGRSLASQASLRRDKGSRPEAELLAAHALIHPETPSARAVVATWSVSPSPTLVSRQPLPPCLSSDIGRRGTVLACREPNALSLWDLSANGPTLRWRLPRTVEAVAVGEDVVAVHFDTREFDVLDAQTGKLIDTLTSSCAREVAVSNGQVVTWSTGCVQQNDYTAGAQQLRYPCIGHGMLGSFALDDDSDWSALCEDGSLITGTLVMDETALVPTRLTGSRVALALGHLEGGRLVAGTADGWLVVLDAATGVEVASMPSGSAKVVQLIVAPDRRLVAVAGADGSFKLVEPLAGLVRAQLPEMTSHTVTFVDDEVWLAADHLLRYRIEKGPGSAFEVGSGITSLAFSPDGAALTATSGYEVVTLSMQDGSQRGRVEPRSDFIKGGAYTTDGETFLIASSLRSPNATWAVDVWETRSWQALPPIPLPRHARRIATLAGNLALILPYSGGILAFDPRDGERRLALDPSIERFADLSSAPGGRYAVAISEDEGRIVRIALPGPTLEVIGVEPSGRAVAIGVDGTSVAVAGEGRLWFYDADSHRALDDLELGSVVFDEVALSSNLRWVAAGSQQGITWVWRLSDRALVATFDPHDERVSSLVFSPDSTTLASGSWDGWVRLFDIRRLETPASELVSSVESTWHLTLADVLGPTFTLP